jgi:hypothetical protein
VAAQSQQIEQIAELEQLVGHLASELEDARHGEKVPPVARAPARIGPGHAPSSVLSWRTARYLQYLPTTF